MPSKMSPAYSSNSITGYCRAVAAATTSAAGRSPWPSGSWAVDVTVQWSVLEVQGDHTIAEAPEKGGDIRAASRRPVGVDLQQHGGVEAVREVIEGRPVIEVRRELPVVIVVGDAQPVVGGGGGRAVEHVGQQIDVVGAIATAQPGLNGWMTVSTFNSTAA